MGMLFPEGGYISGVLSFSYALVRIYKPLMHIICQHLIKQSAAGLSCSIFQRCVFSYNMGRFKMLMSDHPLLVVFLLPTTGKALQLVFMLLIPKWTN